MGANDSVSDQLVNFVRDAKDLLQMFNGQNERPDSYRTEQASHGSRGRPTFDVSREQLESLLERGFSVTDIAQIRGLSVRTTERRLQEFGISARQFFTVTDDESLYRAVE